MQKCFFNLNRMSTYKTQGIIIKRNNFGESSLLLHIFTKDYGKIEAIARSARKLKGKLKGHLELFLLVDIIMAHGKSIDTITSSLTIENFFNLRKNLKSIFAVYHLLEIIEKTTEEMNKDVRIFNLLHKTLYFLNYLEGKNFDNASLKLRLTILLYQIQMIEILGFSPQLDKCCFCSRPLNPSGNYFSFSLGGIIDKNCLSNDPKAIFAEENIIKLIRFFHVQKGSIEKYNFHLDKCYRNLEKLKVNEKIVSDAIFMMNKFIEFNTDIEIKSANFICR